MPLLVRQRDGPGSGSGAAGHHLDRHVRDRHGDDGYRRLDLTTATARSKTPQTGWSAAQSCWVLGAYRQCEALRTDCLNWFRRSRRVLLEFLCCTPPLRSWCVGRAATGATGVEEKSARWVTINRETIPVMSRITALPCTTPNPHCCVAKERCCLLLRSFRVPSYMPRHTQLSKVTPLRAQSGFLLLGR